MLYMPGDKTLVVLEPGNIDAMRTGRPAITPDRKILIAWTPDPAWLADRLRASGGDGALVAHALREAALRPITPTRAFFETIAYEF
jgi:hypothetical protein